MTRHGQQRNVQRHEIRMLQQLLDAVCAPHARRQPPRGVDGDFRIEARYLHPELYRRIGNEAPDGAKSDDAQGFPGQLDAGEALLPFLDALREIRPTAVETRHITERRNDIAGGYQQGGEDQLLYGVCIRAGSVENRHTALRHVGDRNVVRARARATDRLDACRNGCRAQVVRTQDDRVRMFDRLPDGVARARETVQPLRGNLVVREDLIFHRLFFLIRVAARSPSCSRPICERLRWASRCRSTRACRRRTDGP